MCIFPSKAKMVNIYASIQLSLNLVSLYIFFYFMLCVMLQSLLVFWFLLIVGILHKFENFPIFFFYLLCSLLLAKFWNKKKSLKMAQCIATFFYEIGYFWIHSVQWKWLLSIQWTFLCAFLNFSNKWKFISLFHL